MPRLQGLREKVATGLQVIVDHGLVVWSSGNVSLRDSNSGYVVIKPSGILYPFLTPDNMVVVYPNGHVIGGILKPSTDLESHLFIYRKLKTINAVVHTHSTFATAFAARGEEIPAILTATADEFGGPIPCGGYARIGGKGIGREIVKVLKSTSSRAILLKHHGVFTVGETVEEAVKAAVMVEDVAKTTYYALRISSHRPLESLSEEEIEIAHRRYTQDYGQDSG